MIGKAKANTTYYGLTKLSSSTSSTSTTLAATSSAVKTAYDKAKSAFSGKGLPWALFSITADVSYTAWTEMKPKLTLRGSYAGGRTASFKSGGSSLIYCPFAGRVEINLNWYVGNVSVNGYIYARCYGYQYASDGSDELLDFVGMGAVTPSGSQASGTMTVEVKAGTYIYIVGASSVAGKTNGASNPTNYRVRVQYRNIYD
ncbi:MAG: tail fiber protein [Eubacterium sp.]|nr:tail fiber protein [Eubacterium sp.]